MQIEIGNHVYTVRLVKAPLRDDSGEIVAGLASWFRGEVLISDHVPQEKRLNVLLHELSHQWDNHFGGAGKPDPELEANQRAAFVEMILPQIDREALAALQSEPQPAWLAPAEDWPPPEPGPGATAATLAPREGRTMRSLDEFRNTCPTCICGHLLAVGAVREGEIIEDPVVGRHCIREGFCSICNHAMAWAERVSPTGQPTGVALSGPRFITGEALEKWKIEHAGAFVAAQAAAFG